MPVYPVVVPPGRGSTMVNESTGVADEAKAEMVGARGGLALAARADHVARAVLLGAEKRAAAVHALGHSGLGWIGRRVRAARILRNARARELRVVVRPVPVARPLPDVAGDVEESVVVGGIGRHLRDAAVGVGVRVLVGEVALVRV